MVCWVISQDSQHLVRVGVGTTLSVQEREGEWCLVTQDSFVLGRPASEDEAVDALGDLARWLSSDEKSALLNVVAEYTHK